MQTITRIIAEIHEKLVPVDTGAVADYIPELSLVDPDRFGIVLATPDGESHRVGDTDHAFTIQSVSKAFVYGLVLEAVGVDAVDARVDLEPSGDAFNEISLDPVTSKPMNAMINAGAIAVTGLVPGSGIEERFGWLLDRLSAFAGRQLSLDEAVYRSESETGHRNRAIAYLMRNGGILGDEVDEDVDLYFRQCSILVTCDDLAVMGATLANGGTNPITGERVLSEASVERVLSVMSSSGMYDWSGSWITQIGLPAKSGVGGGIVAVLPGQLSVAVYSPRLDEQGNSVRGIAAFRELSRRFNLHLFNTPTLAGQVIRRTYRMSETGSSRRWPSNERDYLARAGSSVAIIELQGDLFFAAVERLSRAIEREATASLFILDCARVGLIDPICPSLLVDIARDLAADGTQIIIVDPNERFAELDLAEPELLQIVAELDVALEGAEYALLRAAGLGDQSVHVPLAGCDLFSGISGDDLLFIESLMEAREYRSGTVLCRTGDPGDSLFVLTSGSLDVVSISARSRVQVRIAAVSPGACVGEMAVIDGENRSADVVAGRDATCHVLSSAALATIESERPQVYSTMLRNILLMNLSRLRRTGTATATQRS